MSCPRRSLWPRACWAFAAWCGLVVGLSGFESRAQNAATPGPAAAGENKSAAPNAGADSKSATPAETKLAAPVSNAKPTTSPAASSKEPAPIEKTNASTPPNSSAKDAKPETSQPAAAIPSENARLTFSFRYQPWQEVLDWFAEQAGLSLLMESPPPGTFNYTDTRSYSPAEALDVLNGVLLTKGYTLVRQRARCSWS